MDGGGPTTKEIRGDETARPWEKVRPQLRWEDCTKRDVRKAKEKWSGGRRLLIGRSGKG